MITSGRLTLETTPDDPAFARVVEHVGRAAEAGIKLVQLREKQITARVLYELALACVAAVRGSGTRVLVNDRADIARAAGADGVHLTRSSLPARTIRETFGEELLIGVSAHDTDEARAARDGEADFATFSPVYATPSKAHFDLPPVGVESLRAAAAALAPFPLVALGGVGVERASEVLRAGAAGVAGIRLFDEDQDLERVVASITEENERQRKDRS